MGEKQSFNTSETFRVFIDLFAFLSLISRFPDANEGCKIQVTHTQVNFVLLFFMVRPSPFFSSFTVEAAFPDIGSVGRIEK